jgi:hypothetical protein
VCALLPPQEIRHLERQIKKKDKEIKQYSDLVASTKSAIDTLERDQQELAIIKHNGCARCGSSYTAPDASLFPPEPTQSFMIHQQLGSSSPKRYEAKERDQESNNQKQVNAQSAIADSLEASSTLAPAPQPPTSQASGLDRINALKEKARRMKENSNRASAATSRQSVLPAAAPKGILKRTTSTSDDKENAYANNCA